MFRVTGARDVETERRSWLLLVVAFGALLQLTAIALRVSFAAATTPTWIVAVPLGLPVMIAVIALARRGRAQPAALLLAGYAFAALAMLAWAEGPGGNRMSVAILIIVGVGAVLTARQTAVFGLGLLGVVIGLAVAQTWGRYAPPDTLQPTEPLYMPFIRQSVFLGVTVYALRRGYDRLRAQIAERERSCAAAVEAARRINTSLEALVAERTSTLAATRDRMTELAAHLASDLGASLGSLRRQLGDLCAAGAMLGEDAAHHLTRARTAAERLAVMTERLHDHARLGTTALRPTSVDMDALVRDVVDDYRRLPAHQAIEWEIATLPPAWTDPTLIRTVVENLISNAVKFSRLRRPPRIELAFDPARGYFVRDNGVGFDPRHATMLFTPFHRLHAEGAFEGYGIGLANVRRILRHLGSEITADSAVDRGATFWFRLPRDEAGT